VLSCVCLFFTRMGVYFGVCVCVHTHTHTHCRWGARCEPRGRDNTLGEPEKSRWSKLGVYVFVYVYKVHMNIYMLRGGMSSGLTAFLL